MSVDTDFISPKNAAATRILGHVRFPLPIASDDIATKTYVDSVASAVSSTGTFTLNFSGTSADPLIINVDYRKMDSLIVWCMSTSYTFTGNDSRIGALRTDIPTVAQPTADFPSFVLVIDDLTTVVDSDKTKGGLLSIDETDVLLSFNGGSFLAATDYRLNRASNIVYSAN